MVRAIITDPQSFIKSTSEWIKRARLWRKRNSGKYRWIINRGADFRDKTCAKVRKFCPARQVVEVVLNKGSPVRILFLLKYLMLRQRREDWLESCGESGSMVRWLDYQPLESVVLHLFEGPELWTHYLEDRGERKAQHPAGFEPMTSLLWGVYYTAMLQPLPNFWNLTCWPISDILRITQHGGKDGKTFINFGHFDIVLRPIQ